MTNTVERRSIATDVEIRSAPDRKITAYGYAAKFEVRSSPLLGWVETVDPAAFTKTLNEADVLALFNHELRSMLGRVSAGTLRLGTDSIGLAYEIDMPDTTAGRDVGVLIERRDVFGSSFGFRSINDDWRQGPDGYPERRLIEVALRDVGPCVQPAYSDASVSLRSLSEMTGVPVDQLVVAAEADELRSLITDAPEQAEGRAAPTFHRADRLSRVTW